jgi:hypothetical protein
MSTREEVAETLREFKHKTYYKEEIVENICDAINIADPTNTFRTPEDIYALLADIIDPTCEIYWTDTSDGKADKDYVSGGYYSCSHCGHELPVHAAEAWDNYQANDYEGEAPFECCPHCGARIVVKI